MACRAAESWTFCGLVGAFLDLALGYFMLCGAAAAFLCAKFLAVFGLQLPCPCQGLFGRPSGRCLHGMLATDPTRKVACVQASVRGRFPFDSGWAQDGGGDRCFHLDEDCTRGGGAWSGRLLGVGREEVESCGSVSDLNAASSQYLSCDAISSSWHSQGASDGKGKGVVNCVKPRAGVRRRRRVAVEPRKLPPILPSGPQMSGQGLQQSLCSMGGGGQKHHEVSGGNVIALFTGDHHHLFPGHMEPSGGVDVDKADICDIGSNQLLSRYKAVEMDSLARAPEEDELDKDEVTMIRILEQALEQEQAARSALYLELEKERSAAATAADEAMAMILRLQKEKASIEMEARQFQRIVEEKTAYDEEEMSILKEIIVRRERENHFLEKEIELYRQTMLSGDGSQQQPSDDFRNMIHIAGQSKFSFEFADEPEVMLHQISENIREKERLNNDNGHIGNDFLPTHVADDDNGPPDCISHDSGNQCVSHSIKAKQHSVSGYDSDRTCCSLVEDTWYVRPGNDESSQSFGNHHMSVVEAFGESQLKFREKDMFTADVLTSSWQSQTSGQGNGPDLYKLARSHENICYDVASTSLRKVGENDCENADRFSCDGVDQVNQKVTGKGACRYYASISEAEPGVLDVHVIDDKIPKEGSNSVSNNASLGSGTGDLIFEQNGRTFDVSRSYPSSSWLETNQNFHRSISDLRRVLRPVGTSCDKFSLSELRRNSMSAVDKERLKLETEVELLRERLKIVQEGRDKLNFSVEHKEENIQLQLLEEIASQLREIRQLSKPGKAIRRHVSLTPPSSKVNSKKRPCRSFSCGIHEST